MVKSPSREGSERGAQGYKDAAIVTLRPSLAQVTSNRVPCVWLQGQQFSLPALGSQHTEPILVPIDVVELKAPNLARAQSVNGEQKKDGAVTELKWLVSTWVRNDAFDLVPRWPHGESFVPVDPRSKDGVGQTGRYPSHLLAIAKPGSQGMRGRTQGNTVPPLPEVFEISIDVIWREGFEGVSLLVQKGEEALNVPLPALACCQGQSPFLAFGPKEIFQPRIIAAGRRTGIVRQPAKPLQEATSNGIKLFLGLAEIGSPSLSYASHGPGSRDSFEIGGMETMLARPSLDLAGNA